MKRSHFEVIYMNNYHCLFEEMPAWFYVSIVFESIVQYPEKCSKIEAGYYYG